MGGDESELISLLNGMNEFRTWRSIKVCLESLALVEAFEDTVGAYVEPLAKPPMTYRQIVLRSLSKPAPNNRVDELASWESILREYPIADLSSKDRDLIQAALRTYQESAVAT
jgi:hypothetical protein